MGLDMLFEVLRALEGLPAEIAFVWFQRNMNANVRSNVVTLDRSCPTGPPLTGQVEVVCALPTYVALAHMLLKAKGR